ncbi:Uncharacterized membrane protein YqhA [Faunimonas pinastri]|uniref:Uncharacterized membrane protein YqhA n=1 Tax=Faunimonas pinastri TaxID=1855383 RepID=A0A1H9FL35_9HYPH|nr:YqhA family protein [Faunimonas pinastri]SEQ38661.1 Uncharacterized membrane protein YqhA [Faunimonas pinastri]
MLRVLLWFRGIMLIGSAGALIGSLLMFYQGSLHLIHAWHLLAAGTEGHVTVPVLEAVDAFLFGVVLVIFAYGIAIGFVFRLPERTTRLLPNWMKIDGVGQLKEILAEVVVVVLIVIFARVVVESEGHFTWTMLVLPGSILMIAVAIRLLELGHGEEPAAEPIPPLEETRGGERPGEIAPPPPTDLGKHNV